VAAVAVRTAGVPPAQLTLLPLLRTKTKPKGNFKNAGQRPAVQKPLQLRFQ
jgi:hypothetical protein